ncbi:MAG: DUF1906 domain-containing protein [Eubacterium sp.]|nr:DUF1906 domain-containing protein [Eubacterium sp.]
MSDVNVLNSQVYLNAMFGGHPDWVSVTEDGITGTATMQAIVRAFQIHNNVGGITGTIGPLTISKFQSLATISRMNPNDPSNINVCLIQCALFCKGYNAGGITGIYYNAGVAAVSEYQNDAGIIQTGIIDWKVWLGLLSNNWFKMNALGDINVALIQCSLNHDYSDVIGILPCDGIIDRQTVLALIGALQAEEGITTTLIQDLNNVNFGDATTANFPEKLMINQDEGYRGFNKIAQYGLYFNGYHPGNFSGFFDSTMETAVSSFQTFYGLKNIGLVTDGQINVSVMKSLLTSKGDVSRNSKACDCATILSQTQAQSLSLAGYTHVGRYLTGYVGPVTRKYITFDELDNIQNAGLSVFPIYQDGGYTLEYFMKKNQGVKDAYLAINAAQRIGVPALSTIYFAVDFDCYKYQLEDYIVPYFRDIETVFSDEVNIKHYQIGVYGPRYVCKKLYDLEITSYSFVADMSTGYSCNLGYRLPDNWSFDQFYEFQFVSSPNFPLDKVAYSGRDTGISSFDNVEELTPQEMEEDNYSVIVENNKRDYVLKAAENMGCRSHFVVGEYISNIEQTLLNLNLGIINIEVKGKVENRVSSHPDGSLSFTIGIDQDGNISTACENEISEIEEEIDLDNYGINSLIGSVLRSLSLSLKQGDIYFKYTILSEKSCRFDFAIESGDLFPENQDIDDELILYFGIILTFQDSDNTNYKYSITSATSIVSLFVLVLLVMAVLRGGYIGQEDLAFAMIIFFIITMNIAYDDVN